MFGERLRKIREEKRLSITDLAILVGVSTTTVKSWEKNRRYPSTKKLIHLCNVLDVSADYLCDAEFESFIVVEELSDGMLICLQAVVDQMKLEKQKSR